MVLDLLRKNKSSKGDEPDRGRVFPILDAAVIQHSKLYIRFDASASNITGVTGLVLSFDNNEMILELDGVANLKDKFIGQGIDCFFRIVEKHEKQREIFYSFNVKILHINESKTKGLHVTVSIPDSIEGTQRRKSLRLKPDLQKFSHMAFWKYDSSGGFDINKPSFSFTHFKNSHAFLDNMSAGGMRLTLKRVLIKEQNLGIQKGDRFIVFFTFAEKLVKVRDECWLIVKTNNIRLDPVTNNSTLGLEFIANGTRQVETGKIVWDKVVDNVIDDLAQRIYQWHLALYREKGLS